MTKYRFRYAMCVYIEAENEEEAMQMFENEELSGGSFVELEDVSEY